MGAIRPRWIERVIAIGALGLVLTACGGGGGGTSTYSVVATAGAGGTISPSRANVTSGGTATLSVSPNSGFNILSVTGCGGTLSGNTYTTGVITAACTVTASFGPLSGFWSWIGGSSSVGAKGVYGTKGQPAATNMPGVRYGAAVWTDAGGNVWVFGGYGYDATGYSSQLNDLWQYDPSTNYWTWEGGSGSAGARGEYGIKGTPAATNMPGARYGAAVWTDTSGNVWLFGGYGYDASGYRSQLNDLWKYVPSSGYWTWEGGSSSAGVKGTYGIKGTSAAANIPGARYDASVWTDSSGNIWLFGGYGYDASGSSGRLNDLWEYDSSTGYWTWVGGSSSAGAKGTYGTKGMPAAANTPGARYDAAGWIDTSGNLWLFGGSGYDISGSSGQLNDLWKYAPSSGYWAWIGGSNSAGTRGTYGTKGSPAAANIPGARYGATSWTDAGGKVWLFGGYGYDASGYNNPLNDLWEYDPSTGYWTWEGGSSSVDAKGTYGTKGQAAATNIAGARYDAVAWTDAGGNVWLFGGSGYDATGNSGYLNDLWSAALP